MPENPTATTERDRFPLVVKLAAGLVVAGVLVGSLLLSGSGGDEQVAVTNPAVPTITDAGGSGSGTAEAPPRPAEPPPVSLAAPAVGTETAVIAPKTKPKPTAGTRPGREPRFARLGRACPRPGAISLTRRGEPLVCRNGRWDELF